MNKSKQGLPKKIQTEFNELEDICNPQFNYKKYRKIEQEAEPPFIPFLGMHMRDMFFMNDGNPSKLSNGLMKFIFLLIFLSQKEKENYCLLYLLVFHSFDKLRSLSRSIDLVLNFQKKTFFSIANKESQYSFFLSFFLSFFEPDLTRLTLLPLSFLLHKPEYLT